MLSDILFNVLAITVIVGLLAFVIIFITDAILYFIYPSRNGIFFNRDKKGKDNQVLEQLPESAPQINQYYYNQLPQPEVAQQALPMATVTPYMEEIYYDEEQVEIDFSKAIEEQKIIERKRTHFIFENSNIDVLDFEEETEEIDDFNTILNDVQNQALKELVSETMFAETKTIEETPVKKVQAKIIYKTVNIVNEEQTTDKEVELTLESLSNEEEDDRKLEELRQIRQEILNLRVNTFNTLQEKSDTPEEVAKLEEGIREKLNELDVLKQYKQSFDTEKEALIRTNLEFKDEIEDLEKEVEDLEKQFIIYKNQYGIIEHRPYYDKEYYLKRLAGLEEELTKTNKELRLNKRELNPLRRIQRTFERDDKKLRRREAIVAKQKLRVYGVNKVADLDDEKVKKLEEEVEILTELKDSVHKCRVILEENKVRIPVLERANTALTRHIETLEEDTVLVKKSLSWFELNAEEE